MKTQIFQATVKTFLRPIIVAVAVPVGQDLQNTKRDIREAACAAMGCGLAVIKVNTEPERVTRRSLAGMDAIKQCHDRNNVCWAWVKPA